MEDHRDYPRDFPFPPPRHGSFGVYRCRGHYHVGYIWEGLDWDGEPEHGQRLDWEECRPGTTFERAAEWLVRKWERDGWNGTIWDEVA